MTYSAQEYSATGGAPVELYLFERGVASWRYTSADETQIHLDHAYTPAPIERGSIDDIADLNRRQLQIDIPRDLAVVQQFIAYPPGEVVTLKVFRSHRTDVDNEMRVIWVGRVLSARWNRAGATLVCEPISTSLKRTGLRRRYGRQCDHVLYGPRCGVTPATYRVQGTVAAITGKQFSIAAAAGQADGYFNGGYLWWQLPDGRKDARMIIGHVGDLVTLAAVMPAVSVDDAVELYPGCDHTISLCDSRFGNSENNGGFMFTPGANPFGGKTLY